MHSVIDAPQSARILIFDLDETLIHCFDNDEYESTHKVRI
jgi:predicted HAD superfamily phosphohydrolase YqeG